MLLLTIGAAGIGIGDSAYFGALKHIGPRRALLIAVLSPPITRILAQFFWQKPYPLVPGWVC